MNFEFGVIRSYDNYELIVEQDDTYDFLFYVINKSTNEFELIDIEIFYLLYFIEDDCRFENFCRSILKFTK